MTTRAATAANRVWTGADIVLADGMERQPPWRRRWRRIYAALGVGYGSPDSLRMAVKKFRTGTWDGLTDEVPAKRRRQRDEVGNLQAEAILSRPPARIAALLEQLPACERGLVAWQGWAA